MLNWVFPLSMFIFFIVFIIFNTLLSQKYVIYIKTTTSAISLFMNKHIIMLNEVFNTHKTHTKHNRTLFTKNFNAQNSNAQPFFHCNPMHHTSMHPFPMHHSPMHSTPRYPRSRQQRPELFCECPNMHADRFYRFFRVQMRILSWSFLCFV